MKTKFYFTFVLILFICIFLSNCGGNDVTQTSLYTQTSNDNTAYIIIHVKWPSGENSGNYMISSGSEDTITASLTKDTHRIELKIYDNLDSTKPLKERQLLGEGTIIAPQLLIQIPVKIKLPTIPVTIYAETFQGTHSNSPTDPIFSYIEDFNIKVGPNQINMNLGDYALQLLPEPSVINLVNSRIISSVFAEPTPAISYITARLIITSPDMTPSPYPTFLPKEDNIIAQDTNLSGRKIDFTIEEGGGNLSPIDNQEINGNSVTAYTDSVGYCTVKFTTHEEGITKIRGVFQPDPNDPNSIYSDYCNVTVIVPPTPTPTILPTPEPTEIPTPLPTPVYPYFIEGTWQELDWTHSRTGKSYTIKLTQPGTPYIPHNKVCMGVIVTDENGQIQEGWVYDDIIDLPGKVGDIYENPGFAYIQGTQYHGISWYYGQNNNNNFLRPYWIK